MVTDGTDADVIRASLRDPEAFAAIFDRHVLKVHGFLARRVGSSMADPLTGETFLVAFERRSTYHHEYAESLPWLYGIAHNLLRHHWRGQAREERSLRRIRAGMEQDEMPDDGVLDRMVAEAQWPAVAAALAAMRPEERDVILLVAWEDLAYADVARAFAVPVGTVRSRLSRGRRHLRELIGATGQEEDDNPTTSGGRWLA